MIIPPDRLSSGSSSSSAQWFIEENTTAHVPNLRPRKPRMTPKHCRSSANPDPAPLDLFSEGSALFPEQMEYLPRFRYMGNKHRLLPWIHGVIRDLNFTTAADVFSGSGSVGYLLKAMGKQVYSADFLNFPAVLAGAFTANSSTVICEQHLEVLLAHDRKSKDFIQQRFTGIFFTPIDLAFLDSVSWN